MKTLILFLMLILSIGYSDDIYLKSGFVIRNVKVIDTTNTQLNIIRDGKPANLTIRLIDRIEIIEVDSSIASKYERLYVESAIVNKEIKPRPTPSSVIGVTKIEYPNLIFLPISFISFGLGIDYLVMASDLNKGIENLRSLNQNTDELDSQKDRKTLLGVVFISAGIVNTIISFQTIEVRVQPNLLSLSYKF